MIDKGGWAWKEERGRRKEEGGPPIQTMKIWTWEKRKRGEKPNLHHSTFIAE